MTPYPLLLHVNTLAPNGVAKGGGALLSCGLEISRVSANIDPSTFSTASPGRVIIGSKAAVASSSSWRLFLEEGLSSRMSFLAVESPENDNLNAFTEFPS